MKRAFSLVELLVVMVIVSVIMALGLAALGKSREIAIRAVCGSHLHQWSIVLGTFAGDHRGRYPAAEIIDDKIAVRPEMYSWRLPANPLAMLYPIASAVWNCPNIVADGGTYPTHCMADGHMIDMPYPYLANGGEQYNEDGGLFEWEGSELPGHAPATMDDPSSWPLMADWIYRTRYRRLPDWISRQVGHLKGGGGRSIASALGGTGIDIDPAGGNQLYNDGSVQWASFDQMQPVWSVGQQWQQWWVYN